MQAYFHIISKIPPAPLGPPLLLHSARINSTAHICRLARVDAAAISRHARLERPGSPGKPSGHAIRHRQLRKGWCGRSSVLWTRLSLAGAGASKTAPSSSGGCVCACDRSCVFFFIRVMFARSPCYRRQGETWCLVSYSYFERKCSAVVIVCYPVLLTGLFTGRIGARGSGRVGSGRVGSSRVA